MQQTNTTTIVIETLEIKAAQVVASTPVELPLEKLDQVAGGIPKGTW